MLSVLFWNLGKNEAVLPHLACLAQVHGVDLFLLAECPLDLGLALAPLNGLGLGGYAEVANARPKVHVLSRLPPGHIRHAHTTIGKETAFWAIQAPRLLPPEVLLAVTHLPSKWGGFQPADQAAIAQLVAEELVEVEDRQQHRNTVFVGDFNMNPYDPGMTQVTGVHGLMTAELANKPDRSFRGRSFRRFYNPMWGFFGDRTTGPPGTYYWEGDAPHNPHWAILDQVLLRPALIPCLGRLQILDGAHALVTNEGVPDRENLSDHLPILFQLNV